MMPHLPRPVSQSSTDLVLADLTQKARKFASDSKSASTKRAYRTDWASWTSFAESHGFTVLPASPEQLAVFFTSLAEAEYKVATIQRRAAAISEAHRVAGYDSPIQAPLVRATLTGIRRRLGTSQTGKSPVLMEDIRKMVDSMPESLKGVRDRALILLGFCTGMRRSELSSLDAEDLTETDDGFIITIRRSKTDQEGQGRKVGIPYGSRLETCPVRSLKAWMSAASITSGPLFRPIGKGGDISTKRLSGRAVSELVKHYARKAGLDPRKVGGHSLRSGMITQAAQNGASERAIAAMSGHKSLVILRRYIQDGNLFRENAATVLGL